MILYSPLSYDKQIGELTDSYLTHHPAWVKFAKQNDPVLTNKTDTEAKEELVTYPGARAVAAHEEAHRLYALGPIHHIEARKLSEAVHNFTGIDIHPGATLGENVFIDHGTGVVIGETSRIGRKTRIYQGVTLGGYGTMPDDTARHPFIGDNCIISVEVHVLGHVVIGNNVTLGPSCQVVGNKLTIGNNVTLGPSSKLFCKNSLTVGNNVRIGTAAEIYDGNTINDGIKIGAGAKIPENIGVIDQDVPAHSIAMRNEKGVLQFITPEVLQNHFQAAGI